MLIRRLQIMLVATSFMLGLAACVASEPESTDGDEAGEEQVGEAEEALPASACTTFYYDAPNGNVVGMCTISCSGGKRCTGIKTAYHDQTCESCSGGGGDGSGNVGCYTFGYYCAPEFTSCVVC